MPAAFGPEAIGTKTSDSQTTKTKPRASTTKQAKSYADERHHQQQQRLKQQQNPHRIININSYEASIGAPFFYNVGTTGGSASGGGGDGSAGAAKAGVIALLLVASGGATGAAGMAGSGFTLERFSR